MQNMQKGKLCMLLDDSHASFTFSSPSSIQIPQNQSDPARAASARTRDQRISIHLFTFGSKFVAARDVSVL